MKKICIVSAQYLPHIGGVENYVANLSAELTRRGHRVTVLTSEYPGEPAYEEKGSLEIYRLPSYLLMDGRFPFLKHGRALRAFEKKFRKREFDLMLVNVRFYTLSLYAVRLAKRMKLRCILVDHGSGHVQTGAWLSGKAGELFEHMITALEKRACREYAGCSKTSTEWLRHFGIRTQTVLSNAIDIEKFERMKAEPIRDFRREYGIPQDAVVIAFVGRLTVEKGVRELVQAVERIGRRDVWLLAAGEGYLREELEQAASAQLRFTGRLSLHEVVSLLQQSDIFCLPSVSEGFPTSVLEATACGCYVITTARGDAKEIIKTPAHGIILPDNRAEGLQQAIASVLDRGEERRQAAALAYREMLEHFTWAKTADRLLKLTEEKPKA